MISSTVSGADRGHRRLTDGIAGWAGGHTPAAAKSIITNLLSDATAMVTPGSIRPMGYVESDS